MAAQISKQEVEQKTRALAEPVVAGEGLELVDVEYIREREGWILRLFIDRPGGGVGVDDCSTASRAVETLLEVEDYIPQEYHLEVSSPGLNRPLSKFEHYERVLGKKVKIKTYGPIPSRGGPADTPADGEAPRKNFTGVLKAVTREEVTVSVEGARDFVIPMKDIAKANLEFEF